MGRPFELCKELEQTNRRTHNGDEVAKLLPNGNYVINYRAMYATIVQWSNNPARPCTTGMLNRGFGLRGTIGRDMTVELAITDMIAEGVIERDPDTDIVTPLVGIHRTTVLPRYTNLRKTMAGLHELDEHDG